MAKKKNNAQQIKAMLAAKEQGKTLQQIQAEKEQKKAKPEKEKKPKIKKKIFKGEIIWTSILSIIWLFGLVTAILGICAFNVGKLSTNQLYQFQKTLAGAFKMNGVMDLRIVGTIFMVVSMIIYLIIVFVYANKATEEANKERRKNERMKILMATDNDSEQENASENENEVDDTFTSDPLPEEAAA